MANRNRASWLWRLAATVAASLCFTTLALPFSPMHLPHRAKLITAVKVGPVSVKQNSDSAVNTDVNLAEAPQTSQQFDDLNARLLLEYGAVLKAQNGVVLPPSAMFSSDEQVVRWQAKLETSRGDYVLQTAAAEALNAARIDARAQGLDITPRDTDAAARDYAYTVKLWMSRVNPGLNHWVKKGRLDSSEAEPIRVLSSPEQTVAILQLEEQGMFFNKDFSKSILGSVAPPGASQHLALLAFDVKEHQDPRVREILAWHGWYQTVQRDEPHFTYLGVSSSELPSLGLMRITTGGRQYWIPPTATATEAMPTDLVAQR